MEQNKIFNLKFLYLILIAFVGYLCIHFLPLVSGISTFSVGAFVFIALALYLTDNLSFDITKSHTKNYILITIINLLVFIPWFFYTWDLWLFPFMMIFIPAQIILVILISLITFKRSRVTIFGNGLAKDRILEELKNDEKYIYFDSSKQTIETFPSFVEKHKIKLIILGKVRFSSEEITEILKLKLSGIEVMNYYEYVEETENKIDVDIIDEEWLLNSYGFTILHNTVQAKIKRIFDIVTALLIGIMTAPIMLVAALIVRLESPGPVIYRQDRVGEHGKEFAVLKFRSMRNDAEKNGAQWAQVNDPRITKFGNFMRKTRIDELPQLLNVLKGEMSFIGPRPERMVFIEELEKQIPHYNLRHLIKPGLTGWAQVMYPYGASVEDAKRKLEYDLHYIKRQSFYMDMVIMFKTLKTVLFGKGR
jgi:exopolysaccharide biosynthesis polyprenyl glycosylphosphotransferase